MYIAGALSVAFRSSKRLAPVANDDDWYSENPTNMETSDCIGSKRRVQKLQYIAGLRREDFQQPFQNFLIWLKT